MNLYIPILFLCLLSFWVILTYSLSVPNLIVGALLSLFSIFLSKKYLFLFHFTVKKFPFRKICKYLWVLNCQIFLSTFKSLKIILTGKTHVQIVKIHSNLTNDFSLFILAHSITLTPGTITLCREGQDLLVLCLYPLPSDMTAAGDAIKGYFETLLLED